MGQGAGSLSCCSSENTTACIDRDLGCKDFCIDDMRAPEDEWTPMQVASLEASDFERIDPWTSPLSVAQLQADRGGLLSAMAMKKAPVTRAPPDYLADTPGTNTIVWNKAHDGHILADWPPSASGPTVPSVDEVTAKEVQRRAESNALLGACSEGGADAAALPRAAEKVTSRTELRNAMNRRGLLQQEQRYGPPPLRISADEVDPAGPSSCPQGTRKREAEDSDKAAGIAEREPQESAGAEKAGLRGMAGAKVASGDASEADAAAGDGAGDEAGGMPAPSPDAATANWVATWEVAADSTQSTQQEAASSRAQKQQAEMQRLRMELERLEAMHNAEFGSQAKPQAPSELQSRGEVLPPLAACVAEGKW